MSYTTAQQLMYDEGRRMALDLQSRSADMDGTALISEEEHVPKFDPKKDYSGWKAGYPVKDEGQVWILIIPHNASYYEGRPSTLRALWGLSHTKDPGRAKPWVNPYGTSGMYMKDECYIDGDMNVFRCNTDNVARNAKDFPGAWTLVQSLTENVPDINTEEAEG